MILLTSTAYFPPLSWYLMAASSNEWQLEAKENFQKGGYRNRCKIATANGLRWLTIPLEKGKHQATPIQEVQISQSGQWAREHCQSIRSAYGRAPYFEFYAPALFSLLNDPPRLLWEHNQRLLSWVNERLLPPVEATETKTYRIASDLPADILDLRAKRTELPISPPPYLQLFSDRFGFQGELSILDLLFCQGPAAASYLRTAVP